MAIAAKLMPLLGLRKLLQSGVNIWKHILDEIGLGMDFKSDLKPAIYSILFGMSKMNLTNWLIPRFGAEATRRLFFNAVIQDLLVERTRIYRKIAADGGMYDAFGVWIEVAPDRRPHAILCSVAQSYELKIMLAALPVLLSDTDHCHVHSWLHDSVSVNVRGYDHLVDQIVETLNREITRMGLLTEVEISS